MGQVLHRELIVRYSLGGKWKRDSIQEEIEQQITVCQPESIERLLTVTKFTRRELKVMYRGFKQVCPSGFIVLERFKDIFAEIFPQGASSNYATFVFNAIRDNPEAQITFTDLALVLSTLSRGTAVEKLEWTFRLYDVDRDGFVTFNDLFRVITSIHELIGSNTDPPPDRFYVKSRATEVFEALDISGNGAVSRQQYVQACLGDPFLCESLEVFNTIL